MTKSRDKFSFSDIIKRIKLREMISSDAKIAELLGLERTAFAERKRRNSLPYKEIVIYCEQSGANLHYLLTGEGLDLNPDVKKWPLLPLELRDLQMYNIRKWSDEFWVKATEEERAWLYVELQRAFPEFKEWIKKREKKLGALDKEKK